MKVNIISVGKEVYFLPKLIGLYLESKNVNHRVYDFIDHTIGRYGDISKDFNIFVAEDGWWYGDIEDKNKSFFVSSENHAGEIVASMSFGEGIFGTAMFILAITTNVDILKLFTDIDGIANWGAFPNIR